MKLVVLLFFFFFIIPVFSQKNQVEEYVKNKNLLTDSKLDIMANLELVNKVYCKSGVLNMSLRLTYKNSGTENIIMFKNPSLRAEEIISRVKVDGKLQIISKGQSSLFYSLSSTYKDKNDTIDKSYFIILAPGESYEIDNLGYSIFPLLKNGKYTLESEFITFPFSYDNYVMLQTKWKDQGMIWFSNVNTEPMKFTIKDVENKIVSKCADLEEITISGCHVKVDGNRNCEIIYHTPKNN